MAEQRRDDVVRDLSALGRAIEPPLSANLRTAVMDRVAALPSPSRAGKGRSRVPPRFGRIADVVAGVGSRRRIALVVAAVLVVLLATPPVRATVVDWFTFGGVMVEHGSPGQNSVPPPPEVPHDRALSEAATEAGFVVSAPVVLGAPDGVQLAADRQAVSMSWSTEADGVLRLDQFDRRLDFSLAKTAPHVFYASVGGSDALWFEEPHEVVLLEPDGTRRTESARLAGHTLIWLDGSTTLRLEGEVSLGRAVEIAESVVPVS